MNQKILKDYFSFTKKERVAVLCLALVSVLLFVLPSLIPERQPVKLTVNYLAPLATLENQEKRDGITVPAKHAGNHENYLLSSLTKSRLFYFDPNVLTPAGWEKMGLPPKTIRTIQNYLSKGGRFRSPEDLGKIYGLHPDEISRLLPFVRIAAHAGTRVWHDSGETRAPTFARFGAYTKKHSYELVDINKADTAALIALPGIGSRLSARIIRFRESLGGFFAIEQVKEVYGLQDSTFRLIAPRLSLTTLPAASIDLNTADENRFKSHPYIKWNVARAIVTYRQQHGNFTSVNDLKQLDCINDSLFNKIAHYVMVSAL